MNKQQLYEALDDLITEMCGEYISCNDCPFNYISKYDPSNPICTLELTTVGVVKLLNKEWRKGNDRPR